ncbi:HSP70-domain-containing protein [Pluteus cervinus]|uniref:HSP70-domain-containing protein n=1 Tax=Pluteus cervinus TaxID=181527 RepID=A0ACD3B8X8_9AGAR|nr:HSP70-domain-containing protein [Pluteus cervinus]
MPVTGVARLTKSRRNLLPSFGLTFVTTFLLILLVLCACSTPVVAREEYGTVIGIDLGTTNSYIAVKTVDGVEIIPDDQGNKAHPSWASCGWTGTLMTDECAKDLAPHAKSNGEDREYPSEEIALAILRSLKERAETYLGENITHAIAVVPSSFDDTQRKALKSAGSLAGLTIIRFMNEPAAAALAYGDHGDATVFVYHLGDKRLSVSVLEIESNAYDILATVENPHLGGKEFNRLVVDYLVTCYEKGLDGEEGPVNSEVLNELENAVEKAKRQLSTSESARVEDTGLVETLTRTNFEELNSDLFEQNLAAVKSVLKEANVTKDAVDKVILVGGSTRIPRVQSMLEEYFGKQLEIRIPPEEVVAYGAAVWGGILFEPTPLLNCCDITRLGLGLETAGGIFTNLVPRNSILPLSKSQNFTTAQDNQESVAIKIYEGERVSMGGNRFLGEFELSGIAPAPKGVPVIEVKFEIDTEGALTVSAVDKELGLSNSLRMEKASWERDWTDAELVKLIDYAYEFVQEDQLLYERIRLEGLEGKLDSGFAHDQPEWVKNCTEDCPTIGHDEL